METTWPFILKETDTLYYCALCGCDVNSRKNAEDHFRGKRHTDAVEQHAGVISRNQNINRYYCHLCKCNISGYENVRGHLDGERHKENLESESSRSVIYYALWDKSPQALESETSEESDQYVALKSNEFVVSFDDCDDFECFLCNENLTGKWERNSHLRSSEHKWAVKEYGCNILNKGTWYYCNLCDCPISGYENVYGHVHGKKHEDYLYESEFE